MEQSEQYQQTPSGKPSRFLKKISDSYHVLYLNGIWVHMQYDVKIDAWHVYSRVLPINHEYKTLRKAKKKTNDEINRLKILWE